MRAIELVTVLAACGYPRPPDRCEGPCALYAVDRSFAFEATEVWLEGTFEETLQVNFPGGIVQSLDVPGDHRVAVSVPMGATAGDLTVTTTEGTTAPIPFRRTTFKPALQPFMVTSEQTDYARTNWFPFQRSGGTAVTIKNRVYLIAGNSVNGLSSDVDVVTAGMDGAVGTPIKVGQLQFARMGHTSLVVGRYLYVFGGTGGGPQYVERAMIDNDGRLGAFEVAQGVTVQTPRNGHASVIVGNYVYLIGGSSGTGSDLDSIERAQIDNNGDLGPFEQVAGRQLLAGRTRFSIAVSGTKLFIIGGQRNGSPIENVERAELRPDASIGDFEPAGSLAMARAGHVSTVVGDTVYVFGGENSSGPIDSVESAKIFIEPELLFAVAPMKLSSPRQNAALTVVGNYVYLFGGLDQNANPVFAIERASIIDSTTLDPFIVPSATLQTPRTGHASVVLGNKLYVIGGRNTMELDSVEVSEILPDGSLGGFSTTTRNLIAPRAGHALLVSNNRLYVIGGRRGNTDVASIEVAQINEDGSLEAFQMHNFALQTPRSDFVAFGVAGYPVVGGGATGPTSTTSTVERGTFNAQRELQQFTAFGDLINPRQGAALAIVGNHAYVISGGDSSNDYGTVRAPIDLLNVTGPFADYANTVQLPRHGHIASVVGNNLYVIGGTRPNAQAAPVERATINADGVMTFTQVFAIALSFPRSNATTVTIGNFIYVIGGDDGSPYNSVETATIR